MRSGGLCTNLLNRWVYTQALVRAGPSLSAYIGNCSQTAKPQLFCKKTSGESIAGVYQFWYPNYKLIKPLSA